MFWRRPTAGEAAEIGCKPEDYAEPKATVWPENWPAIRLFMRNSTQWRVGSSGPVGLDYGVLYRDLDRRNLTPAEYDETMAAIRTIERAALDQYGKE